MNCVMFVFLFVLSPCPNNQWLCSHPTCCEQWPDEVGCVTEPILVIKPFDDEKLVRLLFNMRKREEWRVVGVYVLHQQPHTFLGGENGRERDMRGYHSPAVGALLLPCVSCMFLK